MDIDTAEEAGDHSLAIHAVQWGMHHAPRGLPRRDPTHATYDELDFQRAVQTYIWTTSAVGAQAVADGLADLGLSPTTVGIFEDFLDANTVVAKGNGESIYAFGAIDLGQAGPVLVRHRRGLEERPAR